ncbi:MAG: helix-turn-helix domain-containing protein [Clostridiales bacterium]|nr:helix-turn-helix domain-containing protein [Clostridiales bacterium]
MGLAEELGKTDRSISDMENGKATPKLNTVALFARRWESA